MTLGAHIVSNIAVYGFATQIGDLIHGLTNKSDTVVEFDSDRCFFLLWLPNLRELTCLSTAAAMLS